MPLRSNLFSGDRVFEACLLHDAAHITPGAVGQHVVKIQAALMDLDNITIDQRELAGKRYGPATAAAVLSYKQKRNIINKSYQTSADNIVGKMTIAAMDLELFQKQEPYSPGFKLRCERA
jgi:hypothetical protein